MATRIQPDAIQAPVIPWSIDAARALYNVEGWGAGYFDINDRGHVIVRPDPLRPHLTLDLRDLAADLEGQGIQLPVLLRFSDILRSRIETLSERFATAIKEFEYTGGYTTVYPIKVNQQRHVVEEIVQFGKTHGVGLECGSKPELQAVLGLSETTEHLIVCNGYKDHEFMRLALMGQKLGHQVFIVLEQVSELDVLLEVAEELNVKPTCGVRIKLASEGAGRWAQSGGEKSKFGLSSAELIKLIDKLESAGRLDILKLIHFHLGSQITDIRFIKSGLAEVARFYLELRALGVDITHVDVGGGLGIDYDGTNSTNNASVNYTLQEYANDVIYTIAEACREAELPMPHIISESGRALTAHHALLLLKVIDVESQAEQPVPPLDDEDFSLLHEMHEDWRTLIEREPKPRKVLEVFHDASFDKERARQYFNSGVLNLRGLAKAEVLWLATMNAIYRIAKANPDTYEDILPELESALVDRYFCNFSLFQSLPDSWAIDQLFPIMPIHRLTEEPVRRGTLQDVTCDSDGKIDHFVDKRIDKKSLELHEVRALTGDEIGVEPYYLGVFLLGAYQEILGDLHNLLGDTHAVHISVDPSGGWDIEEVIEGDTVEEVLSYVQYDIADMKRAMRLDIEAACKQGRLTFAEGKSLLQYYDNGLEGYTYLEE